MYGNANAQGAVQRRAEDGRGSIALFPIMAAVFVAFLVIGMAMPVLPLHVHEGLALSTFIVGLVAGTQFGAAILSRVWAGRYADASGAKRAVIVGLLIAAMSGLVYLASLRFVANPTLSATILLLGRALLGVGESFIITGGQSWGLAILGLRNTSKVLAWVGSAMFAAFAAGAPVGAALYGGYGFTGVALATTLLPVATLALVAPLRPVPSTAHVRTGLLKVMAAVWVPGVGAALSSVGFGAVTAFSALLFVSRGWPAWPAFSTFALAFILTRMFLGHLADRFGGAKVALISVLVEAVGLGLIELAPGLTLALIGAALTGLGYSLVYPGLGVEAVRRVPADSRGLAMGAYTAFLDVALGFGTPALGLLANIAGLSAVFLASAVAALCAVPIAASFLRSSTSPATPASPGVGVSRLQTRPQELAMKLLATAALASLVLMGAFAQAQETNMTLKAPSSREDIRAVAPALHRYTQERLLDEVWKRPGLGVRDRSIVTLAALIARNQPLEVPTYMRLALDSGVKPGEISEIITHLAFYSGWGNAMGAAAAAREVFAERKVGSDQLPAASPSLLPLNEAAEADRAKRVGEQFGAVFPSVVHDTTDALFRDLWLRPDLAPRDRSLVTVSALIAAGQVAQIPYHLNRAMDNGLTQTQASEAISHLAYYVGWPNVFSAMPVAKEVFEKRAK
jgi:alkylhydroperoxidase/carboxymuconolactone decarboxylase family protein YurZ